MYYKIEFNSVVRGHHVYERFWTPIMGKTVLAKKTLEKRLLNIKNIRLDFQGTRRIVGWIYSSQVVPANLSLSERIE